MSLKKLWEKVKDREGRRAAVPGVTKSRPDLVTEQQGFCILIDRLSTCSITYWNRVWKSPSITVSGRFKVYWAPVHSKWYHRPSTCRTPLLSRTCISFLSWFSYTLRFYTDYKSQSTWLLFLLKRPITLSRHFNNVENLIQSLIQRCLPLLCVPLCRFSFSFP